MARIRTIKPEFWEDEKLSELPMQARLLYIGCWNFADDNGILSNSVKWLKAKIFPYDTLRDSEIKQWCDALVKNRMLIPFAHSGKGYYIIRRFRSHQIIDKRYVKEILPTDVVDEILSKTENGEITAGTHGDYYVNTPPEGKGREGKGREGEGGAPEPPRRSKKVVPHLFRDSKIFEKKEFSAALENSQYAAANVDYYHEVILNWSDSKHAVKADWLATAKNWMAKDMTEGKFITQHFKPPQNGFAKNGKQPTGANVDSRSAFAKIDRLPD